MITGPILFFSLIRVFLYVTAIYLCITWVVMRLGHRTGTTAHRIICGLFFALNVAVSMATLVQHGIWHLFAVVFGIVIGTLGEMSIEVVVMGIMLRLRKRSGN